MRWLGILMILPLLAQGQNAIGTGRIVDLYRKHCQICHGEGGRGGLGGSLREPLKYAASDEDVSKWIREGNPALGMPAFKQVLGEEQIRSLVIYLHELQQLHASERQQ